MITAGKIIPDIKIMYFAYLFYDGKANADGFAALIALFKALK